MKNIAILVPESAVMEAVADPRYLFNTANHFLMSAGQPALFKVQLVAAKAHISMPDAVYTVHVDSTIYDELQPDLIIIPALYGNMQLAVAANHELVPWITRQYHAGSEVASLCVGAFLLGATGLLDGKKCSTHWAFYEEFRQTYPQVEVVDGSIITEENRLYSSGGANSYWNLLLYLLEKYTSRDIAILAAKYFAIDIDRDSQSSFAIFNGQKDHTDLEIRKAQHFIEDHFQDKLTVDQLADMVAMSRRTFERRFKHATSNTVLEYIQRVKIEAAKRSFELSRKNIAEVMYDVGYTDTKAFRSIFKKITGLTPVEYRNKYQKVS